MSSYTPGTFADALLHLLGLPDTGSNRNVIVSWEAAEGGNWHNPDKYNPLDTTISAPGARSTNSAGVKAYTSWGEGINATARTLEMPAYAGIRSALAKGNDPNAVRAAITASPWGTKSLGGAGSYAQTPASSDSGSGGKTSFWSTLTNPVGTLTNAAAGAVGSAFGSAITAVWNDAKPFLVKFGFVGLGLALIGAGVVKTTAPARRKVEQDLPAVPQAAGGSPGAAGEAGEAGEAGGGAGLADVAAL